MAQQVLASNYNSFSSPFKTALPFTNTNEALMESESDNTGPFFKNQSNSFFGNNPPISTSNSTFKSFFDKTSSRDDQPPHSNNIITSNLPASSFLSPASHVYSKLDQLSENEKICFEEQEFSSIIPLKSPPYELCF